MPESKLQIKLSYVHGLRPVVLKELENNNLQVTKEFEDSLYIDFIEEIISVITSLKSIARAYIIVQDETYHPVYISNHKSIVGNLIDVIFEYSEDKKQFKTCKISCAGSESSEIKRILKYVKETYLLTQKEEADLKIHIIKINNIWEVGVQITPRPLSVREYKVSHMSGAMDSTVAYAVNSFCNLEFSDSYLNIFSGSATLLIEAGLQFKNIKTLIGFDNDKKHLSLSIKNIKKSGLMKRITVKESNIFDEPSLSVFDAITSDLPFGMMISKEEDLKKLYTTFLKYCEHSLHPKGRLVVYTSKYELFELLISSSNFKIIDELQLKFITNSGGYLKPKIFVCEKVFK